MIRRLEQIQAIDCLGKKRCPRGANNSDRIFCRSFFPCLATFILDRLVKRKNLCKVMGEVRNIWPTSPDYLILHFIGTVASSNMIRYGRGAVDCAIRSSEIHLDAEPKVEASEIRRAFGVHGREGKARTKNPRTRGTGGANPSSVESFLLGHSKHWQNPQAGLSERFVSDNAREGLTYGRA